MEVDLFLVEAQVSKDVRWWSGQEGAVAGQVGWDKIRHRVLGAHDLASAGPEVVVGWDMVSTGNDQEGGVFMSEVMMSGIAA